MILKLKRIRSSCKYIRVHCGLSSSVVWIASISVRFRSKEQLWKTAWKMAPAFILWLSFHFLRSQNQISHSSVFLCSRNQTEMLATRASSSLVHYCDRKTSLDNRCYFFAFSRQAKTHSAKWARSARHTQWGKAKIVSTGLIFSVPSSSWVSHAPSPPCAGFGSPEKREEITPVKRAVGKQSSFS